MKDSEKSKETEGQALKKKGNRRAFLTGAAGATVGATAAALLPQAARKAEAGGVGEPLIVGEPNWGDAEVTELSSNLKVDITVPGGPLATLAVGNDGTPVGPDERARALIAFSHCESILGVTDGDPTEGGLPAGLRGIAHQPGFPGVRGPGDGVAGHSGSGTGVFGGSESGYGVEGSSQSWVGVRGTSGDMQGVLGDSGTWIGVMGVTDDGIAGVVGIAPGDKPGVHAHSQPSGVPMPSDGGVALAVSGKAQFSSAGSGVVPARSRTVTVADTLVTADSHITVTLTGDPGNAATAVHWVQRRPGSGFILHLSTPTSQEVPFTYFIVEPYTSSPPGPGP